ncbi:MAG: nucleotidyltransferase domain-containing protein [Actinomycetota bacterium]
MSSAAKKRTEPVSPGGAANAAVLKRLVAKAGGDPDVLAVLLFGSAARGEAHSASDVDVCLVLSPSFSGDPSQKRLEYLSHFDLDVQVFQRLPLYVRRRVLKDGWVLLSKDDDALYGLALQTVKAFEDFRPHYQRYLEAVLHAG